MKYLKLNDLVWVDGYKSKVTKITDDGVVGLILDEGLITEFHYDCSIYDISLDNDGDFVLDTEFVPMIGDVISVNEEEYQLIDIEENVVTLQRGGDEIRYYSFYDIEHDIINDYWISSVCQQVRSPAVKRKLDVYEVQGNVYLYKSFDELKEIYGLLSEPHISEIYAKSNIDTLIDSLQCKYGLLHYWEDYDSEWDYTYRYIKAIDGGYIDNKE